MATVSGTTIVAGVRQRADAELLGYVDASWRELYDLIVAIDPTVYATVSSQFTVTSTATASLSSVASTCYRPLRVEYYSGGSGTGYVDVPMVNPSEANDCRQRAWNLMGSTLYFYPPEQAPGTYRMWYVPTATAWTSAAQTTELYNGWEEYLVCSATAMCLAKEESDPSFALASKANARARIEQALVRTLQEPPTVLDLYPPGGRRWQRDA
jgi:hypothetical protein